MPKLVPTPPSRYKAFKAAIQDPSFSSAMTPFDNWGAKMVTTKGRIVEIDAQTLMFELAISNISPKGKSANHVNALKDAMQKMGQEAAQQKGQSVDTMRSKQWSEIFKRASIGLFTYLPKDLRNKPETIPDFLERKRG